MLTLVTGSPGASKTLWTVWHVEQLRAEQQRAVYYHGIEGLTLPWHPLEDPKRWQELTPNGAILVIDEAWKWFPAVPAGSNRPPYVQAFSEHRKQGHDIFLVTQHATDIDTFIRKRVRTHQHHRRAWGRPAAKIWRWNERIGNVEDKDSAAEALTEYFWFPKKAYSYYRSAEIHTNVTRFPVKKIAALGAAIAVTAGSAMWGIGYLQSAYIDEEVSTREGRSSTGVFEPRMAPVASIWDAPQWQSRVEGFQESAPVYDRLQEVRAVPRVSGLMVMEWHVEGLTVRQCVANDQRGRRLPMSVEQCLELYEAGGVFEWWLSDEEWRAREERNRPPLASDNGGPIRY